MNFMNVLKKLPLVRIAVCALVIGVIVSVASFGGTYAWFAGLLEGDVTGTPQMGTVAIELEEKGGFSYEIINNSNVDILLRVFVAVEWVDQEGNYEFSAFELSQGNITGNWELKKEINGDFLVYTGGDPFESTGYHRLKSPEAGGESTIDLTFNWTGEGSSRPVVSLIAEAIQADGGAYQYTVDNGGKEPGVTSWKLGGTG